MGRRLRGEKGHLGGWSRCCGWLQSRGVCRAIVHLVFGGLANLGVTLRVECGFLSVGQPVLSNEDINLMCSPFLEVWVQVAM